MSEVFNRYTDTAGNEHWSDTETGHHEYHYDHTDCIEVMPSAQPMRKKGKWIHVSEEMWKCDQCGEISCCSPNFCPDCGARMVEE